MTMNKVVLVGRLVRDPDMRFTGTGKARAFMTVATKGYYSKEKGGTVDDFIPVTVWGKQAETLAQHAKKGYLLELEGRLKSGSYQDSDGKTVYKLEFVAEGFEFLSRPKGGE
jgi:single-strand DNA-binding protein